MKKILTGLMIAAVLVLGFVGALSVLPHSHGGDFSHDSHKDCPVYQFGLHSVDFAGVSSAAILILFSVSFIQFSFASFFTVSPLTGNSQRAPPAVL